MKLFVESWHKILKIDVQHGCTWKDFTDTFTVNRLHRQPDAITKTIQFCRQFATKGIGPAVRADFRRLYPANAKTATCCPSDDNRTKVTNSVTSARSLWWHVGPYFWPADLTRTANPIVQPSLSTDCLHFKCHAVECLECLQLQNTTNRLSSYHILCGTNYTTEPGLSKDAVNKRLLKH